MIEAGLKCLQGKAIVNSISLKEGEAAFIDARQARAPLRRRRRGDGVRRKGPGRHLERKIEICKRAYDILVDEVGFPPEDIIFDPEHLRHRHRHRGAQQLRRRLHRGHALDQAPTCPTRMSPAACRTCRSRSAATSACARRCIRCSCTTPSRPAWTWASSMPGSSASMTTSTPELRERVEDVVLNRRPDATERLLEIAEKFQRRRAGRQAKHDLAWREQPVREAAGARAGARHHRLRRGRHRGGAHAAPSARST